MTVATLWFLKTLLPLVPNHVLFSIGVPAGLPPGERIWHGKRMRITGITICFLLLALTAVAQVPPPVGQSDLALRREQTLDEALRLLPRHSYDIPENIVILGLLVQDAYGMDAAVLEEKITWRLARRSRFRIRSRDVMAEALKRQDLSLDDLSADNEKDIGAILGLDAYLKVWARRTDDNVRVMMKCISTEKAALVWSRTFKARDTAPLRFALGAGMGRLRTHAKIQPTQAVSSGYVLQGESQLMKNRQYPLLLDVRLLGRIADTRLFDIGGDLTGGWDPRLVRSSIEGLTSDQRKYIVESGYHAHVSLVFFLRLHPNEIIGSSKQLLAIYVGYGLSLASTSEIVYSEERGNQTTEATCLVPSNMRPLLRLGTEMSLGGDYSLFVFWEKAYQQGNGLNSFEGDYYIEGAYQGHKTGVVVMRYFNVGN